MLDLSQKKVIYRIFIPKIRNFYQQRIAQNIRRPGEIPGRKIPGFTQNLLPEKRITGKVGSVLHISVSLGSQIPLIRETGQAFLLLVAGKDSLSFPLLFTQVPVWSLVVSSMPGPPLRRQVQLKTEIEKRERVVKFDNSFIFTLILIIQLYCYMYAYEVFPYRNSMRTIVIPLFSSLCQAE